MPDCIIAMKSRTYAEQAKRILKNSGASIVSLDPGITKNGCAFGIRLPCRDVTRARQLLEGQGIGYGEILGERR